MYVSLGVSLPRRFVGFLRIGAKLYKTQFIDIVRRFPYAMSVQKRTELETKWLKHFFFVEQLIENNETKITEWK